MNTSNLVGIMKMSDKAKHICNCCKHLMGYEYFFLKTDFSAFFNKAFHFSYS